MTEELINDVEPQDDAVESDAVNLGVCALEGCDNPLPPPAVDEHGRRKGGRPSSYCCKAHADAASRQRRQVQAAAVLEPLTELRRAAETFGPLVTPLLDAVGGMTARLEAAEQGALAQVRHAEEQSAAARTEAAEATRQAEKAQRERDRALAQARDDRDARGEAEQRAQRIADEAEQTRREAWARVAEHERARGAAESAAAAGARARDDLAGQLRAAREHTDALQVTRAELAERLEATLTELRELTTAHTVAVERLDAAQARVAATETSLEHAQRGLTEARQEVENLRPERDRLLEQFSAEHTARIRAETRAEATEAALADTRARLTAAEEGLARAHARVDRLLWTRQQHGEQRQSVGEDAMEPPGGTETP